MTKSLYHPFFRLLQNHSYIHKRRKFHDYIRGPADHGTYKIPLSSSKIVGVYSSRGSRLDQEDASAVHALQLDPKEISRTLERSKIKWDPLSSGTEFLAGQVAFFGIYDGHGGKDVAGFLRDHLHELIESVEPSFAEELISWTKERHGGYYRRWRGGNLSRLVREKDQGLMLDERLTLAFLQADRDILERVNNAERCGSTGTVALLHSLDSPGQPYWSSKRLNMIIGHCGDTKALLCHRPTGQVHTLTERHHAEARVEAARLRRMGADRLVADSFGETRWMGAIENTRGFGDGKWKSSGVTAEPEIITRVIDGSDYSYLILVTDGLTSLMSDQELIDLARNASDPTRAAKTIVHFAEDLGANDNCTCIVVPLAGWGKVGGMDMTEERREYRRRQVGMMNSRMQRM
ncbi:hypothetical protein TREMEDRAFT_64254 [Tremella mesenterica DSM 1558]|uniref:uncharacterized protein n=1 Tax=Tremella mesenterica (strain ATCC 24925 / CBS 8224 / DSM 1558 / NBRC 9311 / NRRL Y-6157 / RJB 2259-6 / UBC 559-6) TaxID=578456 RepID=UPI0003F48CB1|nr:uncharacterized protein TREMEDRAFT_64254 [Tremella mesenterica DSM 1558]EIW67659.1 hypothetical protein TREMEDRAFT_64254 [Tremella mesenterica DSM 1558]